MDYLKTKLRAFMNYVVESSPTSIKTIVSGNVADIASVVSGYYINSTTTSKSISYDIYNIPIPIGTTKATIQCSNGNISTSSLPRLCLSDSPISSTNNGNRYDTTVAENIPSISWDMSLYPNAKYICLSLISSKVSSINYTFEVEETI